MDLKIFDVWDHEVNLGSLIRECFNCKNTHIIVDCSKESSLTQLVPGDEPFNIEEKVLQVNAHNEQYCNRVDIIVGNYKPVAEEWVESDITLHELKSKNDNAERNAQLVKGGNLPFISVKVNGCMSEAIRYNLFDNVYHWPTYFLVWNGTKVAYTALKQLKRFPDAQLTNLFIVKNRVAKPHRVLLLNELERYNLLERNHFTMLDPFDQIDEILHEVAEPEEQFYKHGKTIPDHEDHELYTKQPNDYKSTLIDVVAETSMVSTFRTEKSVWPIVYMKPYMIMGARYINHNLQKYGFELYDELIDYSFDLLLSPRERIKAMAKELHRLSELKLDLNEQYEILKPKLERNLKTYLELCFHDPYIPSVIKNLGNNEEVIQQQFKSSHSPRNLIHPVDGTWKTFVDRDGGNGTIIDLVRDSNSQYLQEIMGSPK